MKKILGLDLGTTSIGWALVNEAEHDDEQSSIIQLGVRVNPLTTDEQNNFEQGKPITTNAERAQKRSMRRNLQRYKLRRDNLKEALLRYGLITPDTPLCEEGPATTYETLRLRARAAVEPVTSEQLARVLLMLNKKRGYKSNRKARRDDNSDKGQLIDGLEVARRLNDERLTPGQYLDELRRQGKRYQPDFYPSDLRAELERIYTLQSRHYPDLLTADLLERVRGKGSREVSKILADQGLEAPANNGREGREQLLRWRVAALTRRLEPGEVAAVIIHLAALAAKADTYLGQMGDRSKELTLSRRTVGQYMMERLEREPGQPLRGLVFYRTDYLDEFDRIWSTQAPSNPLLTDKARHELRDIIFYQRPLKSKKSLVAKCELCSSQQEVVRSGGRRAMLLVGPKVCPKSSPLYQEFRIWQRLADLRLTNRTDLQERPLTLDERRKLADELTLKDKLSKTDIIKALGLGPAKGWSLNFDSLVGNRTMAKFYEAFAQIIAMAGRGERDLSKMTAGKIREWVADEWAALGFNPDILTFDATSPDGRPDDKPAYMLWHLLYSCEGNDSTPSGIGHLVERIQEVCRLDDAAYAKVLAQLTFEPDYGNISARAIRRILPHMKDGADYASACERAGLNHSRRSLTSAQLEAKTYADRLDILPKGALRNPVVEKILNQMVGVVNAIIERYGRPDEIRVELARDLKKSAVERQKMTKALDDAKREQEELVKVLRDDFGIERPSRNDIVRYRLYCELEGNGYKTLYSMTPIPRDRLFSKDFDIEHIIPQARLFDDSYANKTIEARDVNIAKSARTALDYVADTFGSDGLEQYKARVQRLCDEGKISHAKMRNLLMAGTDIPTDFIERELRDTQYIARQAREMLEQIVPRVVSTTGSITSRLRADWGLVDVMKELNWTKYDALGLTERLTDRDGRPFTRIKDWTKRNDHRHHAMDALTIAFTREVYVQYLNNLNARSDKGSPASAIEQRYLERDRHDGHLRFRAPMPSLRAEAKRALEGVLISIKAKGKVATRSVNRTRTADGHYHERIELTPRGQLHLETIYGLRRYRAVESFKVGSDLTPEVAARVTDRRYREALLARLDESGGDPRRAFTGRRSPSKQPIICADGVTVVPPRVDVATLREQYTVRKAVAPDLNVAKVVDPRIRALLEARLAECGGDARRAFTGLDERPIWLDEAHGIAVRRVTITGPTTVEALHTKRDHHGRTLTDADGRRDADFVQLGNNHHVAIFRDADGALQEHVVTFYEAVARRLQGLPVVDRTYRQDDGWQFLFTMKQNEYFVLPDRDKGFDPAELDLLDPALSSIISPHLYRVQKLSSKYYVFRHHLETKVDDNKALQGIAWVRITALKNLEGIVKVRVNHIGQIVAVGEY